MSKKLDILPQVGRADGPESHLADDAGHPAEASCPLDSGEGDLTFMRETKNNPFARRPSLARTPPQESTRISKEGRERTYTMPTTEREKTLAVLKDKDDFLSKKRKPNSPPEKTDNRTTLKMETSETDERDTKNWEKLKKCLTEMNEFIKSNNNVHKAIKNSVKTLNECINETKGKQKIISFLRQPVTIEDENKSLRKKVATLERQVAMLIERDGNKAEKEPGSSIGIQTDDEEIRLEMKEKTKKVTEEITEIISFIIVFDQ